MPRIRTIKPEYWGDEKLSPLAAIHRLVFLGLISMADDTGRVLDSVRAIDGFVFPNTDDTAAASLEVLAELGRIERGVTASGQRVIQIVNWSHQKIDRPNLSGALPRIALTDESTKRRRAIPRALREAIFERDNGVCQECGDPVRLNKRDRYDADKDLAEIDHIKPVRDGGKNDPQNLRLTCLACNRRKAGEHVRRRNAARFDESSSNDRRAVDEASSNHISTSTNDQRPTTNDLLPTTSDQQPAAMAAGSEEPGAVEAHHDGHPGADPATVLAVAANRGITERYGEQPAPLRAAAGTSLRAVEELQSAGVPIPFARDAIYTAAKRLTLDRPPGSLRYFVRGVVEAWQLEEQSRASAALPAPRERPNGRAAARDQLDPRTTPEFWRQLAKESENG